jgi:hypothetical protein
VPAAPANSQVSPMGIEDLVAIHLIELFVVRPWL